MCRQNGNRCEAVKTQITSRAVTQHIEYYMINMFIKRYENVVKQIQSLKIKQDAYRNLIININT